jgi:4-diphosphocytidyl-2-C-methyl-D-erythritol kinase
MLAAAAGVKAAVQVQLVKRIPIAAGLGGGSSDAAAALVGANELWRLGWTREALSDLAARLGSDVPFFLGRSAAICRGRGEQVEPVAGLGGLHMVVVRPCQGISTAAVYARCAPSCSPTAAQGLVDALCAGDWAAARRASGNRLEAAAGELSPWIDRLRRQFAALDCTLAQMTGSGTGYFGVFPHARAARLAACRLRARSLGRVYYVRSC